MSVGEFWFLPRKTLEDYYVQARACKTKCGFCKHVFTADIVKAEFADQCPPGARFGYTAYYADGRYEVIKALLEGRINWTERVRHIVHTCMLCGFCSVWGPVIGRCGEQEMAFEKLKEECVEVGGGPMPGQAKFAKSIEDNHNPFSEPHEIRRSWLPSDVGKVPTEGELIYFVGCSSSYRKQEIAKATVRILRKLGIEFAILKDEWCCGDPLFRTGQAKAGITTLSHTLAAIRDAGAKKVIFSDPGCYMAVANAHKYGLGELGFEVMHTTELLAPLLKEGKLKLNKEFKEKLTYHDPCHLGRHMHVYEPPRDLLKAIPGVELVEMYRNRLEAWCCGSGCGIMEPDFPDFASWTGLKRLAEVDSMGIKTVVTACPWCKDEFENINSKEKKDVKTYDVMELVAKAMGLPT